MSHDFKVGDIVTWGSQGGGYWKLKVGVIEEFFLNDYSYSEVSPENAVKCRVSVNGKAYFPYIKWLRHHWLSHHDESEREEPRGLSKLERKPIDVTFRLCPETSIDDILHMAGHVGCGMRIEFVPFYDLGVQSGTSLTGKS